MTRGDQSPVLGRMGTRMKENEISGVGEAIKEQMSVRQEGTSGGVLSPRGSQGEERCPSGASRPLV